MTTTTSSDTPSPLLSNRLYDILKWITLLFLPAFGTLYFTLSQIFGLPLGGEIAAACNALALFLGTLIRVSVPSHNQQQAAAQEASYVGDILVSKDSEGHKKATLDFGVHPYDIDEHDEIKLRVKKIQE